MVDKTDTVLNAWYLLEAVQPKALPNLKGVLRESLFTHRKKVPKIAPVAILDQPWKTHILSNSKEHSIQFQYYMKCFEQWQLVEKMRLFFQSDEELIEKDLSINYSFTFAVNNEGKYIEESLFIPFVCYLLKELAKGNENSDYGKLLSQYERICREMEKESIAIFTNGVDEKSIRALQLKYTQYFYEFSDSSWQYLQVIVFKNGSRNEQMNRNSFFISDIEKAWKQGNNETLRDFITGSEKRIDIDNNRELIEQILQPKNLPLGRWPSPVAHRLSLMQQVAVNQIINGNERLHSVNGPPGTGKTTLLKDVFANIVVQRAIKMATYKDPTTAFNKFSVEVNGHKKDVYELDKELKKHSIVVASSNNGAVENISKDLPKRKEIAIPQKNDEGSLEPGIKNEYDQKIAEYLENLDYYPVTAKKLISNEDETWGLFSGIFGKAGNINKFIKKGLLEDKDSEPSFVKQLEQDNDVYSLEDWRKAVIEFQSLLHSIERKKNDLQKYVELEKQLQDFSISKKQGFLSKILGSKNTEEKVIRKIEILKNEYIDEELQLSTDDYWEDSNNSYRQQNVIWQTNVLNYERGLLFLKAMKIHKLFLIKNFKAIDSTLRMFDNRKGLNLNNDEQRGYLKNSWHVIHLVTPLISTTFASLATMYKGIEQDFISYLFIDEAGQASPQLAVGALWRSKKAIVVGDPIQIEPVVTTDKTLLMDICRHFKLEEHFISTTTSVQALADLANPYGTYKDKEETQWIGIPLWVHRRCLNPMFSIANSIAYDDKMVLADTDKVGIGEWIDCKGRAEPAQYVKEQAEYVAQIVFDQYKKKNALPNLFVITPFTAVKQGVQKVMKQRLKSLYVPNLDKWIESSVGTVHTFQGKEADIVYFVTGTDEQTEGAAEWTCSKPNLLNVATTRAKKEFYVVGDLKRFSNKKYYARIIHFMEAYRKNQTSVKLNVPFAEKDIAKRLGAKWNPKLKTWYVPSNVGLEPFQKWLPPTTSDFLNNK